MALSVWGRMSMMGTNNNNNKYNNNYKSNINNKWRHVQSVCLVVNICIYIIILTMMESCCVYMLCLVGKKEKKKTKSDIEYINKRKWSKVFGIIIILMMDVS